MTDETDLDALIWGAVAIGREACVFKKDKTGEIVRDKNGQPVVDERASFYLLESGAIPARRVIGLNRDGTKKSRGQWCTTRRHIRNSLLPEAAE